MKKFQPLLCHFCKTDFRVYGDLRDDLSYISPFHYVIHCEHCKDKYQEWKKENEQKILTQVKDNATKWYMEKFWKSHFVRKLPKSKQRK